jgi:hypothetical protein
MTRPARPLLLLVVVLALAACSGGSKKADDKKPAGAPTPATVATVPLDHGVPPGGAPLTALPGDPGRIGRPALVVKIDNAPKARPQAGLNQADVVIEEGVEGGVTRFATIFHSQEAPSVGPVRSARSTDVAIVTPLNRPLFAYSGANAVFLKLLRSSPLVDVGVDRFPGQYHRERGRPAPYNLFSGTAGLFGVNPSGGAGAPVPLFAYRPAGEGPAGSTEPARRIQAQWRGRIITTLVLEWDPAVAGFARTVDGAPHLDADGRRIAPENVVLQMVRYRDTGLVDTSGAPVPEAELVGEGEVWVLTGGRMLQGKWSKPAPEAPTRYLDPAGAPLRVTPGRTWVELVPAGNATLLDRAPSAARE